MLVSLNHAEGLQEMRGTDPQVCMCWGAMAGEGMTIPLWGADVARPHPSRTYRLDSASALGDTKPRGCVLHLIAGAAGRCVGAAVAPGPGRHRGRVRKAGQQGWASAQGRAKHVLSEGHLTRVAMGDDTLFLHCGVVWNSFLVPRNYFGSPQQWDLEERGRNCAEGLVFISWSHICLTSPRKLLIIPSAELMCSTAHPTGHSLCWQFGPMQHVPFCALTSDHPNTLQPQKEHVLCFLYFSCFRKKTILRFNVPNWILEE